MGCQTTCTLRADRSAMQQWRDIQASHQTELQRLHLRISFIIQDMDALGRCCRGEAAMDFQPASDSFNLHRPLASFPDFVSPAPAVRSAATPKPEVASLDGEQRHTRGRNTQKLLVSVTSSPEARCKHNNSPLGFSCCSSISDGAAGTKWSLQDKTKAAQFKNEAEALTKVTKAQ